MLILSNYFLIRSHYQISCLLINPKRELLSSKIDINFEFEAINIIAIEIFNLKASVSRKLSLKRSKNSYQYERSDPRCHKEF